MKLISGWSAGLATLALVSTGAAAAQQGDRTAQAPKGLALVGVTQIGDRVQAWLVNRDTRAKATLQPGETAFGYRLQKVGPEQVTLVRNGKQFVLRLDDPREPESLVAGYRSEARSDNAGSVPNPEVTVVERTPSGTTADPAPQIVNEVVVGPTPPVVTGVPGTVEDLRDVDRYPVALDPYVGSGYAPFYVPDYLGAPGYYPPWAPQYPVIAGHRYPYAPYAPYTPDWPEDLRFVPSLRFNPQTFRREAGDFFGGTFSANPQTRRRRAIHGRFAPGTWGGFYYPPNFLDESLFGR